MIKAYTICRGDKNIASFDGYDKLYGYAKNLSNKGLLAYIMGCAEFILLSGEVPLKIDLNGWKLYALGWQEVKVGNKEKSKKGK